ncbi:MAG: Gfo/Idh/MocA family oxidoreductase [Ignavibacteria bacterium]|nr:Gfo/Idh/MocA family oxidoreductase [Ignavibacteria bacterium]
MKKEIEIGIIGCGAVAQIIHLPLIKKLSNVKVKAICDIDKRKLNAIKEKYNIELAYSSPEKFFQENEFDAVMILTPTNTHKEIAELASDYCKNLFIEKPAAPTFKETEELEKILARKNVNAMIGFNMRFRPDAMLMKSLVEAKEFGTPYLVRVGWFRPRSSSQSWFVNKSYAGGGVIMDLAINIIDLAMWMLDYPEIYSVTAYNFYHTTKNVEDSATAMIKTKKEQVINFEVSWTLSSEDEFFYCNLFGTEGVGLLNPLRVFKQVGTSRMELMNSTRMTSSNLYIKSYENELKHFFAAVNGLGKWVSTLKEACARMKLIETIYKSAQSNKEIKL